MNLFSTLLDGPITRNGSIKSAIPPIPLNGIHLKAIYSSFIIATLSAFVALLPYPSVAATPESDPHSKMIRQGNFSDAVQLLQGKTTEQLEKNEPGAIQSLIQLADAQNGLGEYQAAASTLANALRLAKSHGDSLVTASVLGALGSVYIALDDLDAAENFLKLGSDVNDAGKAPMISSRIYNDLGNLYTARNDNRNAIQAYLKSVMLGRNSANQLFTAKTLANAARAAINNNAIDQARKLLEKSRKLSATSPPSHQKNYLLINLAQSLQRLAPLTHGEQTQTWKQAEDLLVQAANSSNALHDPKAESYALGYRGSLYESQNKYQKALRLSAQAIFKAQQADSKSAYYLWEWQRGRILNALNRTNAAIAAYRNAVAILQSLRYRLAKGYGATETSFRKGIGPVYLELVDLLLKSSKGNHNQLQTEQLVREARDTVELLKAAELRNYFQDECVDALLSQLKVVEEISTSAAVVYPIILHDRLELLLNLPGRPIRNFSIPVDQAQVEAEILNFRTLLEKRTTNQYRIPAQNLYNWLIKPLESELSETTIDTLVFVPEGLLGTIPMSALYDGQKFLIENFAIGVTPGISLTDPQPINPEQTSILIGGLSQSVQGFPALVFVPRELNNVQNVFGGTKLMDEAFRAKDLKKKLETAEPNIVHIATHGKFEKDSEQSFLLTYDDRITMHELADYIGLFKFRDTPLELLVLSACETARGDARAALGLSGIAVKAGARSALGSLWKVNDAAAAELIGNFYSQLRKPNTSRAKALQQAQLSMLDDLRYRHPSYWAAFLMINSWL